MSESSEPTIIEYARFYGLIKDHRNLNPLTLLPEPDYGPLRLEEPNESANIGSLQTSLANEKLVISKDAAKLLLACTTAPTTEACGNEALLGVRQSAYKEKVEVPILLTDHELDVQRFGQRVEPDLAGFNLPYERIDEEHDEGFTWPDKYYIRRDELDSNCIGEKIEATRDVFVYLQNALDDSYTEEDEKALLESELKHNKVSPSSWAYKIQLNGYRTDSFSQSRRHFFRLPRRFYLSSHHRQHVTSICSQTIQVQPRHKPRKSKLY